MSETYPHSPTFFLQKITEKLKVFGNKLSHTPKQAQLVGIFRRAQAAVEVHLRAAKNDLVEYWLKFLALAVLNHTTTDPQFGRELEM